MDYLDIRFALAKKGYTMTRLGKELDLAGPSPVIQVLKRKYQSRRVEERVSEITGIPLHRLFPDRYKRAHRPTQRRVVNGGVQ